ncbi:MAG: glycosyltransferase [Gemmatimonadaceae bacterium]
MSAPRVLFLDHTAALGGAELCLLDVAEHLRERSTVALLADGPFRPRLEARGVRTIVLEEAASLQGVKRESRVPGPAAVGAVVGTARALAKLARNYDVVYANSQKAFIVACVARAFSKKPVLWHLHDILDPTVFSRINIGVDVFLANHVAARVICNSQATASALTARGGTRARVDVVYNGLDPAVASAVTDADARAFRASLGLGSAPVLGLFGRIAPWKGQSVAIRALALLADRPDVQLVIVGDALFGEQAYAAELRALVDSLGLAARVHFLGFRTDVPVLMRAVDVLIHTSTAPEPFGRVIAEGMLAERPVIATAGGGASEIVRARVTAWQIGPNDPAALAAAIREVLADPSRAREVAKAGRADALARFTLAVTLPQTERAIELAAGART